MKIMNKSFLLKNLPGLKKRLYFLGNLSVPKGVFRLEKQGLDDFFYLKDINHSLMRFLHDLNLEPEVESLYFQSYNDVEPHTDPGDWSIIWVIKAQKKSVVFKSQNLKAVLKKGDVWLFPSNRLHSVRNLDKKRYWSIMASFVKN
jgi:hypothetical protein